MITVDDLPCPVDWRPSSGADEVLPLAELEKRHIQFALEKTKGNVSLAAQLLDVDRATVYNKIKKYALKIN